MRCLRNGHFLLIITFGLSFIAWGQGGNSQAGRGAPPQQSGAGGRGARGGGATGGGAAGLYNYDATAIPIGRFDAGQPAETHQKITVNGETIAYTARAGFLTLRDATIGQAAAHLFFTYYSRDGVGEASLRPLVFFLGAGPGVAAGWQDFGGLGPKRMKWTGDGATGLPPYAWADNPNTLLGQADLVFVNPVGTAYSRPEPPSRGPEFWTTAGDIASMGEFVRGFRNTYDRRNSPLFLAGEDFGTGRAAGLAGYLQDRQVPVHGLILLSVTPSADSIAGDEQYITLLPSLVLTAWHHKKLAPELQKLSVDQIAEQARQFASRAYLHALYKGDRMTPDERSRAVDELSRLTGLSKAFLVSNDLRVPLERFNQELLRDQRQALSNSDARVTGFVPAAGGGGRGGGGFGGAAPAAIDYNQLNLAGGFLTAYQAYLHRELSVVAGSGIFYLSGGGVGAFTSTGNDDASLTAAFARNPRLRLYVSVNYFDLNAPFYATEFTLAHLSVSPDVRARNISVGHYEAGQMTYIDNRSLAKLQSELARFINETAAPAGR